jgi:choline-sulfatase
MRRLLPFGAASFLASAWAFAILSPPSSALASHGSSRAQPPVILISIDTLRADHLGCYGNPHKPTPNLDALAQSGALFASIDSQVPLTLPSHTSLLSSTYPFVNGVEENGDIVPKSLLTLPMILKSHGYRTAAFIGGYFLAKRFGLDQGFDDYDSPFDFPNSVPKSADQLKRPARAVAQDAARWIQGNSTVPFFAFVHLFDLHRPYDLEPSGMASAGAAGYDAELAQVDHVLGAFFRKLQERGIFERALIVVTSDHGESLGQHGESTHGYFIYQSTLWVPLIIHWPAGVSRFPARVEQPAGLIDIAPTILQFLRIPAPPQFQGHSLYRFFSGSGPAKGEPVLSESLYAHDHLDCAALRGLHLGRFQYIDAPRPELYDLAIDPDESHNLELEKPGLAAALAAQFNTLMAKFRPARPPHVKVSQGAEEQFNSLGYMGAGVASPSPAESGPDPKDRLPEYHLYLSALRLQQTGDLLDAVALYGRILKAAPDIPLVRFDLASCYYREGKFAEAIRDLKLLAAQNPRDLAVENLLGLSWAKMRNAGEARAAFQAVLTQSPSDYVANYNLGMLDEVERRWASAAGHFKQALLTRPDAPEVYNALGVLFMDRGDTAKAQQEFQTAIRLNPADARADYNLGILWASEKRYREAAQALHRALAANPNFLEARRALAALPIH